VQAVAFAAELKEPAAQLAHDWFLVALPATLTNCPAVQPVHGVHEATLLAVLNVPATHALQTRLATAVPATLTNCPAAQLVQPTQGLAGLRSWSHVPSAHACGGASAPAQYSPALQGVQVAGVSGQPGATCFVPAAHEPCATH